MEEKKTDKWRGEEGRGEEVNRTTSDEWYYEVRRSVWGVKGVK